MLELELANDFNKQRYFVYCKEMRPLLNDMFVSHLKHNLFSIFKKMHLKFYALAKNLQLFTGDNTKLIISKRSARKYTIIM